MSQRTIAHLSDLHLGRSAHVTASAEALRRAVDSVEADFVLVTGDVTDRGRNREYEQFNRIFGSLKKNGRLIVIPGNHDCLSDNVAKKFMSGPRVDLIKRDGVAFIRINSTNWHNRFILAGHGSVNRWMINEVDRLLKTIPSTDLVIAALHHHLLPLPEEGFLEYLAEWFHLPFAAEVRRGPTLLECLQGRCDLVLHGHRHVPGELILPGVPRQLRIYNAGSSTLLGKFRLFSTSDGALAGEPIWIDPMSEEAKINHK